MRSVLIAIAMSMAVCAPLARAQQADPYKVLDTTRVGGEGGWDYIYADANGRRLYIPRGAAGAVGAAGATPGVAAAPARLTIFDLDTLKPVGAISGVGGQGTAVDPKTDHGFTSDHPKVSMFDTKTMTLIKRIDVGAARPDGIYFDPFNERVYVFSHPTRNATVIDAKDGAVLGTIDLGGTPEQGVGNGKGMLYVVMQDAVGSVTAVDVTSMKVVGHYSFVDKGSCNGLAVDVRNEILFAACRSGSAPGQQPSMVILSARDGKVLTTLPLAGGSDGAVFNPATMEAFSTQGNGTMTIVKEISPTSFKVEQNLQTMNGARTLAFDSKTGHLFTMSQERGPVPAAAAAAAAQAPGGRPPQGPPIPGSFSILTIGKAQ